jgi:signal transduction histidine kinase
VGERFRDHLHPDDRAHVLGVLTDALRCRTQWEVEVRLRNQAGEYRWLLIRGEPRTHRGGATAGYIGTATDVTERRLEAESLAAARNAAVDAARLKSDFLATMSHEIRTPMHGIFGMTELALDTPDDTERREFMLRARACAKTLMTLLDEILDFSRLEAGRAELLVQPFELGEIVFDAVNTVSVTAARKGLELVVDCHPDLPERLLGDAARIRQILTNLLANAVKFTAAGEVVLTVDALARDGEGGGIRCAVRDTGIGLEAHQVESIFDAFTQGDRAVSREYGGTGLGLAITPRLVTLMGGRVTVESTPGRGSIFEVRLPLPPAEVESAPGEPRIAVLHRTRVLVVTDNATCRRVVATTLAREGAEIVDVPGDARALAHPPTAAGIDVVVIDTDKAGTRGIQIARRLRARPDRATLPVVFLSPLEALAQAPADLQPVHVVRKPFRSRDLVRALVKSLHGTPTSTPARVATAG